MKFVVFSASSACGVSVEHMNAKKPIIRGICRFHHEKFMNICCEYGVTNDLTKWRNQKYFSMWQSRDWETGKPDMSYIIKIHSPDGLLRNRMV